MIAWLIRFPCQRRCRPSPKPSQERSLLLTSRQQTGTYPPSVWNGTPISKYKSLFGAHTCHSSIVWSAYDDMIVDKFLKKRKQRIRRIFIILRHLGFLETETVRFRYSIKKFGIRTITPLNTRNNLHTQHPTIKWHINHSFIMFYLGRLCFLLLLIGRWSINHTEINNNDNSSSIDIFQRNNLSSVFVLSRESNQSKEKQRYQERVGLGNLASHTTNHTEDQSPFRWFAGSFDNYLFLYKIVWFKSICCRQCCSFFQWHGSSFCRGSAAKTS